MRVLSLVLILVLVPCLALAQVKTFEMSVEEPVGKHQSQEQVEAYALQKAKRLAVEKAGTYLSSLAVVKQGKLSKQEITALASGIVRSDVADTSAFVKNKVVYVKVDARVSVDSSVLDEQVKAMLKDNEYLKELEAERKKSSELEKQLAELKSTDMKRLENLNKQAVALEIERENQRLFREEQRLKAQKAMSKADQERLKQDQKRHAKFQKMSAEQEAAKKKEQQAIEREQDRIKKAQLENERRAKEIARRAEMNKAAWVPIDDSLSLNQAIEESKKIKKEMANLTKSMDTQYELAKKNLQDAYQKQIAATSPSMPAKPAEKDPFETTAAYEARIKKYEAKVKKAKAGNKENIKALKTEERIKLAELKVDSLERKIEVLTPFAKRLKVLRTKTFLVPDVACKVALGNPDADHSCFPLTITCGKKTWNTKWKYTDTETARSMWKTKAHMTGQALYQVAETKKGVGKTIVGAKVSHPGLGDERDFVMDSSKAFAQVEEVYKDFSGKLVLARKELKNAPYIGGYVDPITGMEFVWIPGGCFMMGSNNGDRDEKPVHNVCVDGFLMGKYEVTQAEWQKIMGNNPSRFTGARNPVERVSWKDAQQFISKLNSKGKAKFRLPTEAEWEYACRAGTNTKYYWGDSNKAAGNYAWYNKNSRSVHPVGQKKPNRFGLYDMSGNVLEWCQDWYGKNYYSNRSNNNPIGPLYGEFRVLRGGSWFFNARTLRSAFRGADTPDFRTFNLGFRLVMPITPSPRSTK